MAHGRTELHYALREEDLPEVERLLAEGADPRRGFWPDPARTRPVDIARARGLDAIAGLLERAGQDAEGRESGRHDRRESAAMPLWAAADRGNLQEVQRLLAGGADPNASVFAGGTPVDRALARGHDAILAALLAAGGEIGLPTLILEGYVDEVLERLEGSEYSRAELLDFAVCGGNLPLVHALRDATPNVRPADLVFQVLRYWRVAPPREDDSSWPRGVQLTILDALLDAGLDAAAIDEGGASMLHWVAAYGPLPSSGPLPGERLAIARRLLDAGADPSVSDLDFRRPPSWWAKRWGRDDLASLLADSG